MDLIIGKGQKSAILTLCERSRNYLLMARLPYGKNPEKVVDMAIKVVFPLPEIRTGHYNGQRKRVCLP